MPDIRPDGRATVQALAAACCFASMTSLAKLAYLGGADPFMVVVARCSGAILLSIVLIAVLRRPLPRRPADWALLALMGMVIAAYSLSYMASVRYIPIGLATLLFYLWPIFVALVTLIARKGRGASRLELAAFPLAFLGLAFAIGPSLGTIDLRGVGLVVLAAIGFATFILVSGGLARRLDGPVVTCVCNLSAVSAILVLGTVLGGLDLPQNASGQVAMLGLGLLFAMGMLFQLAAVARGGAGNMAIFFNLEPLMAIAISAVLLGERLRPEQYLGACLVVGALALSAFARRRAMALALSQKAV